MKHSRRTRSMTLVALSCVALPALADSLAPGDYRFELPPERDYLVHVPPHSVGKHLPVVINLHGGGGSAEQHRQTSGMDGAADRDGYIAVYPNGSGRLRDRLLTWNAGNCCAYAQRQGIDDVGFIAAVIDDIQRRVALDASKVYVVGHSNGGMMAHRIGETLSDKVAAIVSVAGAHIPAGPVTHAVPVMHIHSVDDPRANYAGGLGPPFPLTTSRILHSPVETTVASWVKRNGCNPAPVEKEARAAGGHTAKRLVYEECRHGAEVALWKLTGAGHGWPGATSTREALVGPATKVIDANTEIWRFVSRFRLGR